MTGATPPCKVLTSDFYTILLGLRLLR